MGEEKQKPSNKSLAKARALLDSGKVRQLGTGGRRIYFEVKGETDTHQVAFSPTEAKWSCDCKYFSVKGLECSHIGAARLSLKTRIA